jgi:hypothetical protein
MLAAKMSIEYLDLSVSELASVVEGNKRGEGKGFGAELSCWWI